MSQQKKLSEMSLEEQRDYYQSAYRDQVDKTHKLSEAFKRLLFGIDKLWVIFEPISKLGGDQEVDDPAKINPMSLLPAIAKIIKGGRIKSIAFIIRDELAPIVSTYLPYYQELEKQKDVE